jgi:hypothetical protein
MNMGARAFMLGVATCVWITFGSTSFGQFSGRGGGRHGGGGNGSESSLSNPARNITPPPPQVILTPHGGEYLTTKTNYFEIVYMPLQTRIYLFDDKIQPLSARNLHVQMTLTIPSETAPRQIPFQYVAVPAGVVEQDYVVSAFDIRQLTERETPIRFDFSGLSDHHDPTASFTPVFSPSKIRPYVARVLPTKADEGAAIRQRVCPVTGQVLGSRGPAIKVFIADYPLYLSGEDCIPAVQQAPEKFLPQPASPVPGR